MMPMAKIIKLILNKYVYSYANAYVKGTFTILYNNILYILNKTVATTIIII